MSKKSKQDSRIPQGYQRLPGSERPSAPGAKILGVLEPHEQISVTLVIRPRPGSPALPDFSDWQKTPLSRRRPMTSEVFARTYGAAQPDLDAVAKFAKAHGMRVLESHAGRRCVSVQGTAAQMNAAFGIELKRYETPLPKPPHRTRTGPAEKPSVPMAVHVHHGYEGPVHIPPELAGIVIAVVGLDNRAIGAPAGSGDPSGSSYLSVPTVAANYYNFPNSGAADQTIGVIAPQSSPGQGASYLANDINNLYFPSLASAYTTPPALIHDVNLTVGVNPQGQPNTFSNSPATVQGINASTNLNAFPYSFIIELTQDISTSATIAQGATVNVYFTENSELGWLVFLNRLLFPESEKQPTVVTCSFSIYSSDDSNSIGSIGDSGSVASVMSALFQQLALLGINVFIALGDWGADDGVIDGHTHVMYPGSDPWITSCGGTIVGPINPGPPTTFNEVVWSDAFSNSQFGSPDSDFGATGGGASANFPVPWWQTAAGITQITDSSGNALTGRFVPDISAMVGYSGFFVNGFNYSFVGTSCVAPLYAGLIAVLRSEFGIAFGFLNPILYQLGSSVFNDVTQGNNDSGDTPDSPYFNAGPGWDPCTGWGSVDGTKLLNGIANSMFSKNFYFVLDKSTYGLNEVSVVAKYPNAFWLVLEGFTPNAVGTTLPNLTVAGFNSPSLINLNIGTPVLEIPSQLNTPQRIMFPYEVDFSSQAAKPVSQGGVFPAPGAAPIEQTLTASIPLGSPPLDAATIFELVGGADPFFTNINSQASPPNVWYLSQDLRVFTVTPGINNAPIAGVQGAPQLNASNNNVTPSNPPDTNAAFQYIQSLLQYLETNYSDPTGPNGDPFTLFPDQSSALTGDSSVTPSSINPTNPSGAPLWNYNFAVARVRMNGAANSSSGKNVRVFFRMFNTQTNDTDYDVNTTYPSNPPSQLPESPQVGTGTPPVTIPFFATGNFSANSDFAANVDYSANSVNNKPIQIGSTGNVWAYYGCYLNIYALLNTVNSQSVQSLLAAGTHHCLVAQIAFDDAPIVNSNGTTENPENSDKLAQRNLQITYSENPGPPATHRIPQSFDLRPSRPLGGAGNLLNYPDELMIDWGQIPAGSTASIYWPQLQAVDILELSRQLYSTDQLLVADANTVQCTVPKNGITWVPIPPGSGERFAGLFTVDLPPGTVTVGEVFNIIVRRVSSRNLEYSVPISGSTETGAMTGKSTAAQEAVVPEAVVPVKVMRNWRYIVGTFAVRIPVTTAKTMLPLEENTLAIMKWRLNQMLPSNRWYPVLLRYIQYISDRINGLGGNASSIEPSPYGTPPLQLPSYKEELREFTGKVVGLTYDRFGDFEGFYLLTEEGHEKMFRTREREIEQLVRTAWLDRMVITVFVKHHEMHYPVSIVLRRAPRL